MKRKLSIFFYITAFYLLTSALFLFFYASLYDQPPQVKTFLDRKGRIIGSLNPQFEGIQHWVPYTQIPTTLIDETLRREDRFFFWHHGINPFSLVKALLDNITHFSIQRGGSTITQQLAKNLIQEKEHAVSRRTYFRKIQEIILALGLELKHSKSWILERYLNSIYYGHRCYGIGAASDYYFSKTPDLLNDNEIGILTSLPRSPARLSKNLFPSRKTTSLTGRHFMEFVAKEKKTSPRIQTTLDLDIEQKVEQALREALIERSERDPKLTAAAVVIDVNTGDIVAMAGSRDYQNEIISGQVNGAIALRQPGSTLKPFTYFSAFTQGFSPDSVIQDQPTSFHVFTNIEDQDAYMPQNFDHRFHGNVTIREALANSYNVPAVVTLNDIGLSYYHEMLHRFGLTSFNQAPTYYGLSITLGSAEVSLLELTNAYAALARGGKFLPYRFLTSSFLTRAIPVHTQAAKAALLTTSILTDAQARRKAFGFNEDLVVEGYEVAVKTGTSYDHRDNWTVGYTPSYAVGVWVGHADGTPLDGTTGASGAAPVWHSIMEVLLRGSFPEKFQNIDNVFKSPSKTASSSELNTWKITSPLPYAHYREHSYLPEDHQSLALEAKAWEKDLQLSWYLDGIFLGTTQNTHKMFIQPPLGKHLLRVTSQNNETESVTFFIQGSS